MLKRQNRKSKKFLGSPIKTFILAPKFEIQAKLFLTNATKAFHTTELKEGKERVIMMRNMDLQWVMKK